MMAIRELKVCLLGVSSDRKKEKYEVVGGRGIWQGDAKFWVASEDFKQTASRSNDRQREPSRGRTGATKQLGKPAVYRTAFFVFLLAHSSSDTGLAFRSLYFFDLLAGNFGSSGS